MLIQSPFRLARGERLKIRLRSEQFLVIIESAQTIGMRSDLHQAKAVSGFDNAYSRVPVDLYLTIKY